MGAENRDIIFSSSKDYFLQILDARIEGKGNGTAGKHEESECRPISKNNDD
jgi:hypothetical protein